MSYYLYLFTSLIVDFKITYEYSVVESFVDIWKPFMIFPLLFAACVVCHTIGICIVAVFADKKKHLKSVNNFYRKVALETIDLLLHIFKVKLHVKGEELIPENKRFLLIGNHLSVFDPMIAMHRFKDKELAFVSKKENVEIPFIGRLMLASGCLALNRENNREAVKTIKAASEHISDDYCSMGIYPEGAINKTEEILLPFHSGSFKIAKKADSPIVVTTIRNTELLSRRFLYAGTDVYLDIIRVIPPEEFKSMTTSEISEMVWCEMYEHLADNCRTSPETDTENQEAAC